jgi:hypothetical protein
VDLRATRPRLDRLRDAVSALRSAAGLDVCIGRRLPSLLRAAGLVDVTLRLWRAGDPYQSLLLTFVGIHRDRLIESGLLAAEELDALAAGLADHLARPDTFVVYTPLFQAWGASRPDHLAVAGSEDHVVADVGIRTSQRDLRREERRCRNP